MEKQQIYIFEKCTQKEIDTRVTSSYIVILCSLGGQFTKTKT